MSESLPVFRCIRWEMKLVFIQHIADHSFIGQDWFQCDWRRKDQLGAGIGFEIGEVMDTSADL